MTFADRAMGMTSWYANGQKPQATVQFNAQFLQAVQVGEFVEARCSVLRQTRSLIFMSADLVVDDAAVAVAMGVWKALRQPPHQ